jgi:hypothetical protein
LKTWVEIRVVLTSRLPMLSEWRGYGTPLPPLCERCARQGPAKRLAVDLRIPSKTRGFLAEACRLLLKVWCERRAATFNAERSQNVAVLSVPTVVRWYQRDEETRHAESVSVLRFHRHPVRDRVVGGSNPLAPTNSFNPNAASAELRLDGRRGHDVVPLEHRVHDPVCAGFPTRVGKAGVRTS